MHWFLDGAHVALTSLLYDLVDYRVGLIGKSQPTILVLHSVATKMLVDYLFKVNERIEIIKKLISSHLQFQLVP